MSGTVMVLGMFDGVHIGHRRLVETARAMAAGLDATVTVYTFSNHPMQLLRGSISLLSDNAERERLLIESGADSVYMEAFTPELCAMPPEAFLKRLGDMFPVRGIVCGFNYTFGSRGAGKPEMLTAYGKEHGIEVGVVSHCDALGAPVSSTRIRDMLISGDTASALILLGHPFFFKGNAVGTAEDGGSIIEPDPSVVVPFAASYAATENRSRIGGVLKAVNGKWVFCPGREASFSGTVTFSVTGRAE